MLRTRVVALVSLAIGIGLAGCTSSQPKQGPGPGKAAPVQQANAVDTADGMSRVSMYFPSGDRDTSSILLERSAPIEVRAGQDYEYVITVKNITEFALQNVVVKDNCASNYTIVSSVPSAVGRPPEPLTWTLGDLGAKGEKQILVKGKALPDSTMVTNCASVSFSNMLCASTNVVQPALKVAMAAPADASLCDSVPFTYTVSNSGTGSVRDVKVAIALPAGWTADKPGPSFDIGTLTAGQKKDFTILAKPNKIGAVTSSVSATASGGLTAAGNTVNVLIRAPALTVRAEAPESAYLGVNMTAKFTVRNTGDLASVDTILTTLIPKGTDFVRADNSGVAAGGKVTWKLGALAVGESRTVGLVAKNTGAGNVEFSASAVGLCAQTVKDTCMIRVEGVPDIGTGISDDDGVVALGDPHVFTYVVKNQGQIDLTGVTMVAELDPGLAYVSTNWSGGATLAGNLVTYRVGTVKVGEQKTFTIVCKGTMPGKLQIQAATTSDQSPRPAHNDEQVNYIEV